MQEVPREQLIPGKEYYLQNFEKTYFPPEKPYKMIAKFKELKCYSNFAVACFSNFRKIQHRNDPLCVRYVELNLNWKFYEIARDVVQKNMEERAYNMVMRQITSDENFIQVMRILYQ
jgi:hypothetical protein